MAKDTIATKFSYDGRQVKINFSPAKRGADYRLSGVVSDNSWSGYGVDTAGNNLTWTATFEKTGTPKSDSSRAKRQEPIGKVTYPFESFGWEEGQAPKQETILIKNATVWTNEKEGILQNADVLIKNGKIVSCW